ncbi:MAG: CoA pyrophosphatase [Desulfobacteraceae bacterium]|jgi:8-oxo-dGTP pyrophosphatase MutT (NUDIX family)
MLEKNNEICLRCDDFLRRHIQFNLAGFFAKSHSDRTMRKAAVAVTIVDSSVDSMINGLVCAPVTQNTAAVILTRRSMQLKHHRGQWAFPGGRCDPGESVEETALRELEEEVGLKLEKEHVMGLLDDFTTRSGFTITPVVLWGGRNVGLSANPAEVDSIHRIPIAEFMRKDAPILQPIPQSDRPVLLMPVGDTCIAAPTAAIIYQFREVAIKGVETRVAHFEQPHFTWK